MEDHLIQMQDIYDYISQFGGKLLICGLDLEAAFNMIDHDYMIRVLTKMNFGSRMVNLMRTIYRNMYSCVSINGAKTRYFRLQRSIRQGDQCAMNQFVLAIEPFANILRNDPSLHPVKIPNQPPKLVQLYADDTNILCTQASDYPRVAMLASTNIRIRGRCQTECEQN